MLPFSSPLSVAAFGVAVALHARFVEGGTASRGGCGSSCIGAGASAACCSSAGGGGDASRAHLRMKKTARRRRAFSSSSLCAAARARLLEARFDGSRL